MDLFIGTVLGCLFIAVILEAITEVIIESSNDKENPEKSRQRYLFIFFFILLLIYFYTNYNRERYIRSSIENSNSVEEIISTLYEND